MADHELDPKEVPARLQQGWQLVDVREPDEREAARIGDDLHIAMDELTERAAEVDRDRPVVFYCSVGNRSGLAAEAFRGAGYDAYNLAGGIEAWEAAGLPLERG